MLRCVFSIVLLLPLSPLLGCVSRSKYLYNVLTTNGAVPFSFQKRAEENAQKLDDVTKNLFKLSTERRNLIVHGADISVDLLSKRKQDAIYMQNGIQTNTGDSDSNGSEDDGYASSAILLGSSIAVKDAMHPIQLPEVKRLPPFTTWIFLDRCVKLP